MVAVEEIHLTRRITPKTYAEKANKAEYSITFLFKTLLLLSTSIRINQDFAGTLLIGEKAVGNVNKKLKSDDKLKHSELPVCDLIMKCIKEASAKVETRNISNAELAVASQLVSCIASLYELCRNEIGGSNNWSFTSNSCTPALKYFIDDKDFFSSLLRILRMEPSYLQVVEERSIQIVEKPTWRTIHEPKLVSYRRINSLYLLSSAMRILSKEIFFSFS